MPKHTKQWQKQQQQQHNNDNDDEARREDYSQRLGYRDLVVWIFSATAKGIERVEWAKTFPPRTLTHDGLHYGDRTGRARGGG